MFPPSEITLSNNPENAGISDMTDAEIIEIAMREDPGNLDNGTYWMFGRATLLRIIRAVLAAEAKKENE